MFIYSQSTGVLTRDGRHFGTGYSGHGTAKNKPDRQRERAVGPIPRGDWIIGGNRTSPNTGPLTITLEPAPDTDVFGRSLFRIHGDSIANPGTASNGCIILPRQVREAIIRSGDKSLRVVA